MSFKIGNCGEMSLTTGAKSPSFVLMLVVDKRLPAFELFGAKFTLVPAISVGPPQLLQIILVVVGLPVNVQLIS